jgi:uncharacterized protein YraI
MMHRRRMPLITKVYLTILIILGAMLIVLVLLRAADVTMDWQDIQRLVPGGGTDEALLQTLTPPTSQTVEPVYPPGIPWLRAVTNASIYDKPNSPNQPAAMLVSGETAQVIGVSEDRQWWAIRMPYFENGQGWVMASQVAVENADQAAVMGAGGATNTPPRSTEQIPVAMAVTNVNVRSGPAMSFEKIGLLNNGQEAEIIGVSPDGGWWAIRLRGADQRTGWVAKDYIVSRNDDNIPVMTLESAASEGSVSSPQPGRASLTAAWTVNIRAGPGKEYAVVGTLQQGQTAEIVGKSEDTIWWAIRFEGQDGDTGWVAAAYVEAENTQNVPVLK